MQENYGHTVIHIPTTANNYQPCAIFCYVVKCTTKPIWVFEKMEHTWIDVPSLTGYEQAFQDTIQSILWSSWWTATNKVHDTSYTAVHLNGTKWKFSGFIQVFCLRSEWKVTLRAFTELPIPKSIVDQVNRIGKKNGHDGSNIFRLKKSLAKRS